MRALCDGRNNNRTHREKFNTFISELRKKHPGWDRVRIGCERSTARSLLTEENK